MPLPLFLLALLVLPFWSPATAAEDRCRQALLSASTALSRAAIDARLQCETRRLSGKPTGEGCAEAARRGIAHVTAKASRRIARACGGVDRRCGTPDDPTLDAAGWTHATCPGIAGMPGCDMPTRHCGDVAACLACTATTNGDALGTVFDATRAADAAGRRCVRTLGRGLAALLDTTATVDDACLAGRLGGGRNGCRTRDRQIAAARTRHEAAVCRGCGGRDRRCDGVGDVSPAAIGWAGACPPGIDGACAGPVTVPEELAACLECLATPVLACAQLLAVPSLEPYPASCGAAPPETTTTSTTTSSSTTSTTSSSTTSTLPVGAHCCPAQRMVIETVPGDGTDPSQDTVYGLSFLSVRITNPIRLTLDVGAPDGDCRHAIVVPPDGVTLAPFCVAGLGLTADLLPRACSVGDGIGRGTLWDGYSTAPDADVDIAIDTSDGVCNPPDQICTTVERGTGANTLAGEIVTRGDGQADGPGLHLALDLPVNAQAWDNGGAGCPDPDGLGNGDDQLAANDFITLRLATATASARFTDTNGDGCWLSGLGPEQAAVTGLPAPGPCCQVGQQLRLVAAGAQLQGSAPFSDAMAVFELPAVVVACDPLPATPASCDQVYGGGQVVTSFGEFDEIQGLASSDGGAFLAIGTADRQEGNNVLRSIAVARYLEDGGLDRTFGHDGRLRHVIPLAETHVEDVGIDASGRPVLGGWTFDVPPEGTNDFVPRDAFVARLLPDGQLDPDFGDGGWTFTDLGDSDEGRAVAARPQGGAILAGNVGHPSHSIFVAAYDDGGDLDGNFGVGGIVPLDPTPDDDSVNAVVVRGDGAVVIGGLTGVLRAAGTDNDGDAYLARLTATGDPDPSFGTGGVMIVPVGAYSDAIKALALTDGGDIIAIGRTQVASRGNQRPFLARFDGEGAPVPGFGTNGIVLLGDPAGGTQLETVRLLPDGYILVGGHIFAPAIGRDLMLVGRLDGNGVPDPTFGTDGFTRLDFGGRDDLVNALMPVSGDRLIVAGFYDPDRHFGARRDFALARLLADGARDLTFGTDQCQWQSPPDLRPDQ